MGPTLREELAVVRAVTFASLFEYPLTLSQLRHSLETAADEPTIERWLAESSLLRQAVCLDGGFVFPRTRPDLVDRRLAREAASLERLRLDAPVLRAMAAIPFVRMVAISGSLAHLNGDENADLDLFIVTEPGRVWTVTVIALVMARATGWRKRLCLNYVVSEAALPVKPADLFAANQIIHLQPVAGEATYRTFLDANPFVGTCYPNFSPRPLLSDLGVPRRQSLAAAAEWMLKPIAPILERVARASYRKHLRRQSGSWHSPEQVQLEAECLKLHTNSHRESVMDRFDAAVAEVFATVLTTGDDPLTDGDRPSARDVAGVMPEGWRRAEPSAVGVEPG